MNVWLVLVVFAATAGIHVAAAFVTRAVIDYQYRAAVWELAQWVCAVIGFVTAVKVSLWYLIPEGIGVLVGGLVGVWLLRRRKRRSGTTVARDGVVG